MGGDDQAARRILPGILLVASLSAGAVPRPPAPDPRSSAAITEISLEHGCSGCPNGSILILRRSGDATLTITGNARFGTGDRTSQGRVAPRDFEELARLLLSQGFFELKTEYSDPQTQDGEWTAIGAIRDGQERKVHSRNHAGPPSLEAIQRAIEGVKARIDFAPVRG